MKNQLTRGLARRLMYVENKSGDIDGVKARIGWVSFSKSGKTVRYRGRSLARSTQGAAGNYIDEETLEEYWVSGVKKSGFNTHPAEHVAVAIDDDALEEYRAQRQLGEP